MNSLAGREIGTLNLNDSVRLRQELDVPVRSVNSSKRKIFQQAEKLEQAREYGGTGFYSF